MRHGAAATPWQTVHARASCSCLKSGRSGVTRGVGPLEEETRLPRLVGTPGWHGRRRLASQWLGNGLPGQRLSLELPPRDVWPNGSGFAVGMPFGWTTLGGCYEHSDIGPQAFRRECRAEGGNALVRTGYAKLRCGSDQCDVRDRRCRRLRGQSGPERQGAQVQFRCRC